MCIFHSKQYHFTLAGIITLSQVDNMLVSFVLIQISN